MRFDDVAWLRDNSPAWRLLRADNAPLVLSFLHRVFVADNVRSISAAELASRLDDELYALNQRDGQTGPKRFPKPAKAYLDDWAAPEAGWLRKYYPEGTDEPHFDATPAVEKALQWVDSLREREFVGTESRLNMIIELLRQIVFGTEPDPGGAARRAAPAAPGARRADRPDRGRRAAHARRAARCATATSSSRAPHGSCSPTSARWRRTSGSSTGSSGRRSRAGMAARVNCWTTCSAAGSRSPARTRAGRSRRSTTSCCPRRARRSCPACWTGCTQLAEIAESDPRLRHIHYDWLDAAERTQATVRQLSEQLRRFLDDQVWFENRRVIDILRGIESNALQLRDIKDVPVTMEIDAAAPAIRLPMERPLYAPVRKARIDSENVRPADEETDPAALFEQVYVDPEPLRGGVRQALRRDPQIGLARARRATTPSGRASRSSSPTCR